MNLISKPYLRNIKNGTIWCLPKTSLKDEKIDMIYNIIYYPNQQLNSIVKSDTEQLLRQMANVWELIKK